MNKKNTTPIITTVALGTFLLLLVYLITSVFTRNDNVTSTPDVPPNTSKENCVNVSVVSSTEKSDLLTELTGAYNATNPTVNNACVYVTVTGKASGGAAKALIEGWNEQVDGPTPTVWTPAATTWNTFVNYQRAITDKPSLDIVNVGSIAQTPLVVAMPQPMAETLGWPDKAVGWSDIATLATNPEGWASVGHPEWGQFKLGKTNPEYSTSGLHATIAAYYAATGKASDLSETDITNPDTAGFIKSVENSVVHYGDTTLTFLDTMTREANQGKGLSYISAVTLEEKSVLDYNRGIPTGKPNPDATPPQIPLAAIYPADGTLVSDNPWLIVNSNATPEQQQAAKDLYVWLTKPEQQERFTATGFRDHNGTPGPTATLSNGLIPAGAPVTISPPGGEILTAITNSWADLRKRARVLVVIDTSGSMGQPVPEAGQSRLALAQTAVAEAVTQFATNDEVGLWIFSTNLRGNTPWRELVPIGPGANTTQPIIEAVKNLVPNGGTGLYTTLSDAVTTMESQADNEHINAVIVLSDGQNEDPQNNNLEGLLDQLNKENITENVRVFTIGYGGSADTKTLTAIAEASRGRYYNATDPRTINDVFVSVLSNF